MPVSKEVCSALNRQGWFHNPGAWVLVDGQFGSTGKGLASSVLAECFGEAVDYVSSNAGPNSGHTSYVGDEKVVLQQLPTYSVVAKKLGGHVPCYLNAGAVIDLPRLMSEISQHDMFNLAKVNPFAALVSEDDRQAEGVLLKDAIGSTGKGTGGALAQKVMRNPSAIAASDVGVPDQYLSSMAALDNRKKVFVEVSQGFSLGINEGFYPFCTSRQCDVAQALADAQIHPSRYQECMMVVRTYPIRVGGNSGPGYPDQRELPWEQFPVPPERTTVTNKVRRIFTWSDQQFRYAVRRNRPGFLFVNFLNYLQDKEDVKGFILRHVVTPYVEELGTVPQVILGGYGARNGDVALAYEDGRYVDH